MNSKFLHGRNLILLNLALGLGTFIQVLDTSIANVAVPYIAGSLSLQANQGTWVITAFAASHAIFLPLTGLLSDYFGHIKLFTMTLLIFALASFFCGISTTLPAILASRVVQGAAAGAFMPLAQSFVVTFNPPEKLGTALGFWGVIIILAPSFGPLISGYLIEEYSWPWIFFINIPICCFASFIVWQLLKDQETKIKRNPVDWLGLGLLSLGVAALQIMLDRGHDLDWFESQTIVALTIIATIAFIYFVIWTYYQRHPIIDFTFFRNRNFAIGTTVITIAYLIYFTSTVTIPLWLQTYQNYTAYWAGVSLAPIGIAPLVLVLFIGKNIHRLESRYWITICFAIFAYSFFLQSNFTTSVSLFDVMYVRFIQGFSDAIFFLPLIQLALGDIGPEKYASASGVFHFIRTLIGSGFGTSLTIELWRRRGIFHHARLVESLDPANVSTFLENNNFSTDKINHLLDDVVQQQAFMLSTNDLSWLGAWLFVIMIPIVMTCKRVHSEKQEIELEREQEEKLAF